MFVLDNDNYYSQEANAMYMSVSQFKDFAGTYGKIGCEFAALQKIKGIWQEESSTAMKVGSYVDAYFEGNLDEFKSDNPELFKRDGELKSDFVKADEIIARANMDEYFMKFMSGEKQVIMTGEIEGMPWKIKMDSYIPDVAIVDLKVMSTISKAQWVKDVGYMDFIRFWGYDYQGAVYQEIVRQNTGKRLPFYIAAITKEKEPDMQIIHVTDDYLDEAMGYIRRSMGRIERVKNGQENPDRCELCDCCRHTKKLTKPITISDLLFNV